MDPLQHQPSDRAFNNYGMMYNSSVNQQASRQPQAQGSMMPVRAQSQGLPTTSGIMGNNSLLGPQESNGMYSNIGQQGLQRPSAYSQGVNPAFSTNNLGLSRPGDISLMRRSTSETTGVNYDQPQVGFQRFSNAPQPQSSSSGLINGQPSSFNHSLHQSQHIGQLPSSLTLSPMQSQLDFLIQNDEFPSLPRPPNSQNFKSDIPADIGAGMNGLMNGSSGLGSSQLSSNSSDLGQQVLSGFGGMIRSYLPAENAVTLPAPQPIMTPSITDSKPNNIKFGLLGLLDVIKMTDKDLNVLALGSDLAGFGLNLNSTECLYSSFTSPFSEQPSNPEPQFTVPSCYIMHPPTLKPENVMKFQIESLFYMFYMMPRDVMQLIAAQELYRREWKYNGELKLWLKQRGQQELLQSHSNIPFIYFDVSNWEPRLFAINYPGNILAGILSEEEIKSASRTNAASNPIGPPSGSAMSAFGSSAQPTQASLNIP